ncbi:secretion ATPase [Klebsiella michiganensis]|uniref:Secretion ATPase n=1 Tax=Klebsiella michiganensis TaxID=1134687 RepID=A0A7H4PD62_9ENTR|nr:secretion ATPase [Klebsiella michiganensis]
MHKELFKTITDKLNFSLRHKTPVILQSEAAECGIACLAMVCGFYGLNIDLFNFRHRYGQSFSGRYAHVVEQNGGTCRVEKPRAIPRPG